MHRATQGCSRLLKAPTLWGVLGNILDLNHGAGSCARLGLSVLLALLAWEQRLPLLPGLGPQISEPQSPETGHAEALGDWLGWGKLSVPVSKGCLLGFLKYDLITNKSDRQLAPWSCSAA